MSMFWDVVLGRFQEAQILTVFQGQVSFFLYVAPAVEHSTCLATTREAHLTEQKSGFKSGFVFCASIFATRHVESDSQVPIIINYTT